MTLTIRRILLILFRIPSTLILVLGITVWALRLNGTGFAPLSEPAVTELWWGIWRASLPSDQLWALAGLAATSVFSLGAELILSKRFHRSASSEIFFFRLFLLTLPLQAVRMLLPLIGEGILNESWALPITRIAWFSRFLSINALLNVGLFTGDLPFQRSGLTFGIGALASLAVATLIPLDITQAAGNLFYRVVSEKSLGLVCISLEILSLLSLLGTALSNENRRYYILAAAFFLIVAASDMLFFVSRPLVIVGFCALVAGTLLFSREIRKIYQWI